MEENNLNNTIQGILAEAANRIREALDKNAGAESEATRSATEFDARTTDGDEIVLDAKTERAGTVVGLLGSEWIYKFPTAHDGNARKQWEAWDGEALSASEFAALCRDAHAGDATLIHRGY